jgi:DNA-binding transcriptional LysR family regulator
VALKLGVSQPAVSNALARLRKLLGDELFVRTPTGMVPTPYAEQLGQTVGQALGLIRTALQEPRHFEPATSERTFTVGMSDIGEIYFLPRLLAHLRTAAPGVRLSTVRDTAVQLKDELAQGRLDLAIGLLPELQTGFLHQRLFTQRYVCLFRQGHKLECGPLGLKEFSAAEHVVVVSSGTGHHEVDELLQALGIARDVRLSVPHFVAIGHILQTSELMATVPERLAQCMTEPFGLHIAPHPAPLPEAAIHAFWHARFHGDAANQWLRGLFFDLFAQS